MQELNAKPLTLSTDQLTNSLSSNEQRVIMSHRSNKKIREYDHGDFNELTKRLYAISKGLGVRTTPSVESTTLTLETLKNQFGDFSMQEIAISFELAFGGKLDVDVTNYDSFNVIYLTNILNAYRPYRAKIIKRDADLKLNQEKENQMKVIDEPVENKEKRLCESLIKIVEQEGKLPLAWDWEPVFFHLERIGELNDTSAQKEKFKAKVMKSLADQAKIEDKESLRNMINDTLSKPNSLKYECRKRRVQEYLKTYLPL